MSVLGSQVFNKPPWRAGQGVAWITQFAFVVVAKFINKSRFSEGKPNFINLYGFATMSHG